MTQVPFPGIGMRGLNMDTPPQAVDHTMFNLGLNIRPYDGSLQAVRRVNPLVDKNVSDDGRDTYAMTQWTNTGSDEVNLAYFFDSANADGDDLTLQVVRDLEGNSASIQGAVTGVTAVDFNATFKLDLFAFNDVLIVNDGTNQPIIVTRGGTDANPTYTATYLLGWFSRGSDDLTTVQRTNLQTAVTNDTNIQLTVNGSTLSIVGANYDTLDAALFFIDSQVQRAGANRITCRKMTTFNNRLIAMNISDNYVEGGNATMAWSTPITQLSSLNGVTFLPATTNTAGDDIITETPGQLLDAGQLANYLVVYKSDSVFIVQDSGDPLYLISQQLFNDDGLLTPESFVDIGAGKHFVVGNNGIYHHDGGVQKVNIAKGRVEDTFFEYLRNKDRTFVFHHQRDKEVWICHDSNLPTIGSSGDGVNCALVYNYELDAWHWRLIAHNLNIRGMVATNLNGKYTVYMFGSNGTHLLSDGTDTNDSARYETGGYVEFDKHDLGDSTMTKRIHAVYPQTQEIIDVSLEASDNLAHTPFAGTTEVRRTFNPREGYKVDFREYGRYFDMRLRQNGSTNPMITGITYDITPGGRR